MMDAHFSPCRKYRYALWRDLPDLFGAGSSCVMFIGLNPSTADETTDDPTIRRCIGFAESWGYSRLCMANLFAFRATDPWDLLAADDPVGPDNDAVLQDLGREADMIVAAWGAHGGHLGRDQAVRNMMPEMQCLDLTKEGYPSHPLYLPKTLQPRPFT